MVIKIIKCIVAGLLLCTIFYFACIREKSSNNITYTLFESEKGWGYNILVNDRIFIHQENIPSLQTDSGFNNKIKAEETALFVIKKIRNQLTPTLNRIEITNIVSDNLSK